MREVTISNDLARAILAGLEMLARRIRNEDTAIESPVIRDVNYCRERLADAITQGEFEDSARTASDERAFSHLQCTHVYEGSGLRCRVSLADHSPSIISSHEWTRE